ncbi:MAG TPA: energy transducer TonB [Thermoanaerobaculia bacterium]|nr:energy transducer TonB [Thermoanaerobaculia bacterium]
MPPPFEYFDEEPREGGVSWAVIISIALHILGLTYLLVYNAAPYQAVQPRLRYVDLISSPQKKFVEAPGAKVPRATPDALYSDANRHAATPHPTGERRTPRPGTPGAFDPGSPGAAAAASSSAASEPGARGQQGVTRVSGSGRQTIAGSAASIDWKAAIRQAGELAQASYNASSSGSSGSGSDGGESGDADTGAISFETQWFDWGNYAQGMVAKIKVNWYGIMPEIIKTGLRGVVTIRFTIHREGSISDITVLKSSGVPPYDFAAMKALEKSSALAHLPANFPKESERVTAMFYYNTPIR